MKLNLEREYIKIQDLKLFFYLKEEVDAKEDSCGYFLGYSPKELTDHISPKKGRPVVPTKALILKEIPIKDILEAIYIPERISKKSFINNLNYTKDFLVKNDNHKSILQEILSTI